MMNNTTTKAQPLDNGVTWAASKSGKIQIALAERSASHTSRLERWQVWGIYTGTHDLAPITRYFPTEDEARAYANRIWRTR